MNDIKDKRVLVVGMGRSGEAAARALHDGGARVAVQDSKTEDEMNPQLLSFLKTAGCDLYLGRTPDDMTQFDMLVLSPGVPPSLDFIRQAAGAGVEITGELEMAYRLGRGKYIAITGTNGKTTTTSLVGEIFAEAVSSSFVVGNIGVAVITKAVEASDDSVLVTECSSFQLETV
ncbi:MAG: Mur ligase family protein, partial [Firmicutes bacterium]|nr:Mur ligase family protein [Bacillota bacterium]